MCMDMNEVTAFSDGVIDKRELYLNDTANFNRELSMLISMAVWGSEQFPKNPSEIKLRKGTNKPKKPAKEQSKEDMIKSIIQFQTAVHKDNIGIRGG